MISNNIKTALLLGLLSSCMLMLGNLLGGIGGMQFALIISLIMNGFTYFFSDRIVLSMYKAKPLDKHTYSSIYQTVHELSASMQIPMPKLWLVQSPVANAFATGRNPKNASVALTTGIMDILEPNELRGVLAHELSHVKNRDILLTTIAATFATAIGYIAHFLQRTAMWNSFSGNKKKGHNPFVLFLIGILMPIAATLIQLALSRAREYDADQTGAHYCKDPLALAAALTKLENNTKHAHFNGDAYHASTASLFIVYPFFGKNWTNLFATHPPMSARIARLEQIYKKMFS